jgi:hypothetical protein
MYISVLGLPKIDILHYSITYSDTLFPVHLAVAVQLLTAGGLAFCMDFPLTGGAGSQTAYFSIEAFRVVKSRHGCRG